ncbi:hypothetical protein [Neisseria montereyensis]|uniref:Uncharacterized protein n=1 Tax=Neisseria montereyensis TaxID=2973938 RepID=A0ABT2FBF6_9NEIS|nr:hypothetical protein [Neisseria montereyensis]MCS4532890.1 hypothetical protein [Neisseria montereyensis]
MGLSQSDFNDFVNSRPDYFRLENGIENMSHKNEMPRNDPYMNRKAIEEIKEEIQNFLDTGR